MLRIVAVADTHTFQADLGELPDGDIFIHAGDFCRAGTHIEFESAAAWLNQLPYQHKVIIAGNHDWCFVYKPQEVLAMLDEDIHYLQDSSVTIEGLNIYGSPWQPEFCDWAFNLPRGEPLAEKWSLIPQNTDILITHGPPLNFGDCNGASAQGCEDLLRAAQRIKPSLHCFGHIHEHGGHWEEYSIHFANVNVWEGRRAPSVFDIDPVSKTVVPVFIPPRKA